MIPHKCIRIGIKQPNRNIQTLNFFNVIFVLEHLGKEALSLVVILQRSDCGFFIHLEGNYQIGFQCTCKLTCHNHGVAAERTLRCASGLICNNFTAAGIAGIDPQPLCFTRLPIGTCSCIPGHILGRLSVQFCVICLQGLYFEFGATVRALHLLQCTIKFDGTVTARTFEFL